jgi:hypothetical protein
MGTGNPGDVVPCGFCSLGNFLIYWETASQLACAAVYSLNGVPPATALCVLIGGAYANNSYLLYMAPSSANTCWYYLQNWFQTSAGPNVGPGVLPLYVDGSAKPPSNPVYFAITLDPLNSSTGAGGNIILTGSPVMSKLTAL